jgi:hypothetical protein
MAQARGNSTTAVRQHARRHRARRGWCYVSIHGRRSLTRSCRLTVAQKTASPRSTRRGANAATGALQGASLDEHSRMSFLVFFVFFQLPHFSGPTATHSPGSLLSFVTLRMKVQQKSHRHKLSPHDGDETVTCPSGALFRRHFAVWGNRVQTAL